VEALTGGRVASIDVPDTSTEGFERFNRYFFAQTEKQGVIIDERFNGGGQLADHIVDYLRQPLRNYITGRAGEGDDVPFPGGAIHGPKVMLINERAGSGGDYLPYTFRQAKLGPLVGKRTWGIGRDRRLSAVVRRRYGDRSAHGDLVPQRPLGREEPRGGTGY
jgi:tricorn protease